MIKKNKLEEVMFQIIKKASCQIPPDVKEAFQEAIARETAAGSRKAFEATLESLERSRERQNLACPDTGWPLFFFKVGSEVEIEGGFPGLEAVCKEMVEAATHQGYLRPTMKHPLTGADPGNNIGMNVPGFSYKFVPGDTFEATFVPKGGGSECFGGTRYQVLAFADGLAGVQKFIIDCYIAASRAGAICPPSVLGVGIGGTADICTRLAKESAALRVIGSRNPEPEIARIEEDLFQALNQLKIGAMGSGGETSVFDVNVEYAHTHIAGIAVAMNANCFIARRATARIAADGAVEELDNPNWFNGR